MNKEADNNITKFRQVPKSRPSRPTRTLINKATNREYCDHLNMMLDYYIEEAKWQEWRANKLDTELTELRKSLSDASIGWTIHEKRKDGSWSRSAVAHIWQSNKDAHAQRDELAARYPERLYAVTPCK